MGKGVSLKISRVYGAQYFIVVFHILVRQLYVFPHVCVLYCTLGYLIPM